MDSALPQAGLRASLRWVICLRLWDGPAQTSGPCSNDWRIMATFSDLLATDTLITSVPAMIVSGNVKSRPGTSLPVVRSSIVMRLLPPTCSEMPMVWSSCHAMWAGEAGRLGVTFFGSAAGGGREEV